MKSVVTCNVEHAQTVEKIIMPNTNFSIPVGNYYLFKLNTITPDQRSE